VEVAVVAAIKITPVNFAMTKSDKLRSANATQSSNSFSSAQNSKSKSPSFGYPTLQALTTVALVLPGLMLSTPCSAENDEVDFQYSHYQEGKRNLYGTADNRNPIEVESTHGRAKVSLTDRVKFAFNYTQDTWSGATPVTTAPLAYQGNKPMTSGASPIISPLGNLYLNRSLIPVSLIPNSDPNDPFLVFSKNTQLVHTLSVASPETRKQGDFNFSYEWDEAAINAGGGISVEKDYESRFANLGGRLDFNQKLTSLDLGLSYTNSDTNALIDHDINDYIDKGQKSALIASRLLRPATTGVRLQGNRQDWGANLGLTQVLTKDALIQANAGFTQGYGYMANPYKVVEALFVDPNQIPDIINPLGDGKDYFSDGRPADILRATMKAFLEKRPDLRNQWNLGSRYVQYIELFDSALHVDYHYSQDDWGIRSHTFEGDWVQPLGAGWTITPRIRYYSQDAANFYKPYLIINQAAGNTPQAQAKDYLGLPGNYSSDQRLSAFGTLSGGVSISKKFTKGITLETGFEYYSHAGSLKMGGGGEGAYANFNSFVASAALKVNLSALGHGGGSGEHSHHDHQHGAPIPAGVMFGHMMEKSGEVMVGYRYMYSTQAGSMLTGENSVADKTIVNQGCGITDKCFLTANGMNMHMHMLDLMYAPTDWLNLMLMPQFVDMNMSMRKLEGAPSGVGMQDMMVTGHINTGMATGGYGDTGMYALFKLWGTPNHHINLTLGATAPTGDVGIKMRRMMGIDGGFVDYGMQLGSGTWDFKPSMTYTGKYDDWSWGAQVNGTKRLEGKNASGYTLGDILQSTAWGSYSLLKWLSTSVRGVYTAQDGIKGEYNGLIDKMGPMDYPKNYGGKYWDVGFGLNAFVPHGDLAGNNLSFEWLQPVATEVNGYQLNRNGALSATWSYAF
jgi:hypothetical protein